MLTTPPSVLLTAHDLDSELQFFSGSLPAELVWNPAQFDTVWDLHPAAKPQIHMHGKRVTIPRWQQAYGADYHFSGQTSRAEPVPAVLQPILDWVKGTIFDRLNGLLLNWYEGPGHYIGAHHDSKRDMVPGAPIVTVSFGEARTFRLTLAEEKRDFQAPNGTLFVLPYDTNLAWKHGVPKSTKYKGRRISVTLRAFAE